MSAYAIQKAILTFYSTHKLYPPGLVSELPCVMDWALRMGFGLKRLVTPLIYVCVLLCGCVVLVHRYYVYMHVLVV